MNMFDAIKSAVDASSAQARATRYRRLMLSAEKMFCVAALSHDQDVVQACLSVATVLREEAEAIDFPIAATEQEARANADYRREMFGEADFQDLHRAGK